MGAWIFVPRNERMDISYMGVKNTSAWVEYLFSVKSSDDAYLRKKFEKVMGNGCAHWLPFPKACNTLRL